jgi:RimJ/RimL family protein N-acetyltransferase
LEISRIKIQISPLKLSNTYKCLQQNILEIDNFKIIPIRFQDRMDIMKWRNEQIYHLRQAKPLKKEDQNNYFNNVIAKIFENEQPNQILFSYLENDVCIGYGGLVHVNWIDKNAEISFVMKTELEKKKFKFHWKNFLDLIEQVAFNDLKFHKIFVYSYNLRPLLYEVVNEANFVREAILKDHYLYHGKYVDVIINSKFNSL